MFDEVKNWKPGILYQWNQAQLDYWNEEIGGDEDYYMIINKIAPDRFYVEFELN